MAIINLIKLNVFSQEFRTKVQVLVVVLDNIAKLKSYYSNLDGKCC